MAMTDDEALDAISTLGEVAAQVSTDRETHFGLYQLENELRQWAHDQISDDDDTEADD